MSAAPHTRPTARHPSPRSGQYLHGVLPQGDHLKEGHLCGDGHFPLAVLSWRPPSPAVARPAGILAPRGCSLRLKPEENLTGLPPHTGSPMSRGRARRVQQPPHAGLHRRGTGPAQGALSWESTIKTNTAAQTPGNSGETPQQCPTHHHILTAFISNRSGLHTAFPAPARSRVCSPESLGREAGFPAPGGAALRGTWKGGCGTDPSPLGQEASTPQSREGTLARGQVRGRHV